MQPPRIQGDERGITLNRTLAWGVVIVIAGALVGFGFDRGEQRERLAQLAIDMARTQADVAESFAERRRITSELEARIRPLEQDAGVVRAQMAEISKGISRIERQLEAITPSSRDQ